VSQLTEKQWLPIVLHITKYILTACNPSHTYNCRADAEQAREPYNEEVSVRPIVTKRTATARFSRLPFKHIDEELWRWKMLIETTLQESSIIWEWKTRLLACSFMFQPPSRMKEEGAKLGGGAYFSVNGKPIPDFTIPVHWNYFDLERFSHKSTEMVNLDAVDQEVVHCLPLCVLNSWANALVDNSKWNIILHYGAIQLWFVNLFWLTCFVIDRLMNLRWAFVGKSYFNRSFARSLTWITSIFIKYWHNKY